MLVYKNVPTDDVKPSTSAVSWNPSRRIDLYLSCGFVQKYNLKLVQSCEMFILMDIQIPLALHPANLIEPPNSVNISGLSMVWDKSILAFMISVFSSNLFGQKSLTNGKTESFKGLMFLLHVKSECLMMLLMMFEFSFRQIIFT